MAKPANLKVDTAHVICPACGDILEVPVVVNAVSKFYALGFSVSFETQEIRHTCPTEKNR